jgi:hypothetical protein
MVKLMDEIEMVKELHRLLMLQYEKMADLRLMYSDVKNIQEKHWHYLYLGNMVQMQRIMEDRLKQGVHKR